MSSPPVASSRRLVVPPRRLRWLGRLLDSSSRFAPSKCSAHNIVLKQTTPRTCSVPLRHAACSSSCYVSRRRLVALVLLRSRLTLLSHYSHCLRSYFAPAIFAMLDQYSAPLRSPALNSRLLCSPPQSFVARLVPPLHYASAAGSLLNTALCVCGVLGVPRTRSKHTVQQLIQTDQ